METQLGITLSGKPSGYGAISLSDDGMISICTDSTIHIATPLITTAFSDLESFVTGATNNDLWPESADMGESSVLDKPLQSSYSMQELYRCAQWSPTGMSHRHGCLLTALTTKHRILLFEPEKDTSNWILYADMTDLLKNVALQDSSYGEFENLEQINRFHSLYIAWSPTLHIDPVTSNPALLAVSNKAGGISLWSYSPENEMQYQMSFQPHVSFTNLMCWSKWRKGNGFYVGYLLSTNTGGVVALTMVKVIHDSASITCIETQELHKWFEEDSGMATVMKLWDESVNTIKIFIAKQLVAYSIVLTVQDDLQVTPEGSWMDFMIPRTAVGVTGAYFSSGGNQVRMFTLEGDGMVLTYQGETWKFDDQQSIEVTKKLQLKYRQRWMDETSKYEGEDILNALDMIPQLLGVDATPHGLYTAILFMIKPVVDLHSYNESRDSTNVAFVMHPQIDGVHATTKLLEKLTAYIQDPDFLFTYPVRSIMHELLEFLLDEEDSSQFLALLNTLHDLLENPTSGEARWGALDLKRQVYSDPKIITACILLYIDTELQQYRLQDEARLMLFEMQNKCRHYITYNFFCSILSFINSQDDSYWNLLNDQDLLQILIWCDGLLFELIRVQDLIPISNMLQPILTTFEKLQLHFPSSPIVQNMSTSKAMVESAINGNTIIEGGIESRQNCPACDDPIPFSLDSICACGAGHVFNRCGATLQLITSPFYQSCIKCGSMRLLPPSIGSDQPYSSSPSALSDVALSNCSMCIYCGSDMDMKKP